MNLPLSTRLLRMLFPLRSFRKNSRSQRKLLPHRSRMVAWLIPIRWSTAWNLSWFLSMSCSLRVRSVLRFGTALTPRLWRSCAWLARLLIFPRAGVRRRRRPGLVRVRGVYLLRCPRRIGLLRLGLRLARAVRVVPVLVTRSSPLSVLVDVISWDWGGSPGVWVCPSRLSFGVVAWLPVIRSVLLLNRLPLWLLSCRVRRLPVRLLRASCRQRRCPLYRLTILWRRRRSRGRLLPISFFRLAWRT